MFQISGGVRHSNHYINYENLVKENVDDILLLSRIVLTNFKKRKEITKCIGNLRTQVNQISDSLVSTVHLYSVME